MTEQGRGWHTPLGGLTADQTATFLDLVAKDLSARGIRPILTEDGLTLGSQSLGLDSLARRCQGIEPSQWPALLHAHFDVTLKIALATSDHDFDAIRSNLILRAYADDPKTRSSLVARADIPGVMVAVVLDLDDSVQSVSPQMAADWNKTPAELFALALENLQRRQTAALQTFRVSDSSVFTLSDEYFGSARALLLESRPNFVGPLGAFVGIPIRDQLICLPFHGPQSMAAMNHLLGLVRAMYEKEPYPVSPVLYYYRDGIFEPIRSIVRGGTLSVEIPPRLAEVLRDMPIPDVRHVHASPPAPPPARVAAAFSRQELLQAVGLGILCALVMAVGLNLLGPLVLAASPFLIGLLGTWLAPQQREIDGTGAAVIGVIAWGAVALLQGAIVPQLVLRMAVAIILGVLGSRVGVYVSRRRAK